MGRFNETKQRSKTRLGNRITVCKEKKKNSKEKDKTNKETNFRPVAHLRRVLDHLSEPTADSQSPYQECWTLALSILRSCGRPPTLYSAPPPRSCTVTLLPYQAPTSLPAAEGHIQREAPTIFQNYLIYFISACQSLFNPRGGSSGGGSGGSSGGGGGNGVGGGAFSIRGAERLNLRI